MSKRYSATVAGKRCSTWVPDSIDDTNEAEEYVDNVEASYLDFYDDIPDDHRSDNHESPRLSPRINA